MADDDLDPDLEPESDEENPNVAIPRDVVRGLRAGAKRAKGLEAENVQLRQQARELAFLRAGVDIDSPVGKLYARSYEGELTKDAITEGARDLGILAGEPAPTTDGPELSEVERAQTDLRRALADNAPADDGAQERAETVTAMSERVFVEAMANGTPRDEAIGQAFRARLGEAVNGNPDALWDPSQR